MEGKTKIHRLVCYIKCNSSKKFKIIEKTKIIKASRQSREKSIKKIQSKIIKYVRGCLSTCHRISRIVYKQDGTRVHNNKRTVGRIPRWKKTSVTVLYLQMLVVLSYNCIFIDDIMKLNTIKYNCVGFLILIKLKGKYGEKARENISGNKVQNSKKCTAIKNNNFCNVISENWITDSLIIQSKNLSVFRFYSAGEKSYKYHCLQCIYLFHIQEVHMGHRIGFLNNYGVE